MITRRDIPGMVIAATIAATTVWVIAACALPYFEARAQAADTRALCRFWAWNVLKDANDAGMAQGAYEADLEVYDLWDTGLWSVLTVAEFTTLARVTSAGPDRQRDTSDDISMRVADRHHRKLIEEGSRSVGKGLARGVIEGIGQATDEAASKAKEGVTRARSQLLARFVRSDSE